MWPVLLVGTFQVLKERESINPQCPPPIHPTSSHPPNTCCLSDLIRQTIFWLPVTLFSIIILCVYPESWSGDAAPWVWRADLSDRTPRQWVLRHKLQVRFTSSHWRNRLYFIIKPTNMGIINTTVGEILQSVSTKEISNKKKNGFQENLQRNRSVLIGRLSSHAGGLSSNHV